MSLVWLERSEELLLTIRLTRCLTTDTIYFRIENVWENSTILQFHAETQYWYSYTILVGFLLTAPHRPIHTHSLTLTHTHTRTYILMHAKHHKFVPRHLNTSIAVSVSLPAISIPIQIQFINSNTSLARHRWRIVLVIDGLCVNCVNRRQCKTPSMAFACMRNGYRNMQCSAYGRQASNRQNQFRFGNAMHSVTMMQDWSDIFFSIAIWSSCFCTWKPKRKKINEIKVTGSNYSWLWLTWNTN